MSHILRTTPAFIALPSKTNGRLTIRCRDADAWPRQRTVKPKTWAQLTSYSDAEFDASCCMELGIGAFLKPKV